MILPRLGVSAVLLWLGCRWLTATSSFSDLILNAVALEFIVGTKDLLFDRLVSNRNKRELRRTKLNVRAEGTTPTYMSLLGSYVWGFVAILWVALYVHVFQQVLPDYNWDIRDMCGTWMAERSA